MTSASDRTDDDIVVAPGEEIDEATGTRVIHASIIHDDEQDQTGPGETGMGEMGPAGKRAAQDAPGSGGAEDAGLADDTMPGQPPVPGQAASSDLPRRAWIPDRPMPGSGRPGQPIVAQPVPAQRAPFGAGPAGPEPVDELDEPDDELARPDEELARPDDEPATPVDELDEGTGIGELGQPLVGQSPSSLAETDEDQLGTAEAARADADQPDALEPAPDNPWPGIQSMFVDDPRRAVEQSAKVASTALADLITAAKEVEQTLRGDWSRDRTGTEELRVALRGYRDLSARIATLTREFQRS